MRRLLGVAGWSAFVLYCAFAVLVLALRYAVLPQIENYRGDVEAALTRALKLPVTIRAIDAGWAGLRPRLAIHGLDIRDAQGRPALGLDEVRAELAWSSLWHFGLRLHRLDIVAPDLDIRRDAVGHFFVAGLEVSPGGADSGVDRWVLAQDRIVVRNAAIRWHDELRGAPTLDLDRVNFDLQNDGSRHRFGLTGEPPAALAARLDVRGDVHGTDFAKLDSWQGEAYAELDYADLAVWRTWLDYPVDLPRGSGGLRLWLAFAAGQPTGATADIRLADVQLRLGRDLPMLELSRLEGRLKAVREADGYDIETRRLALATRDDVRIEPTDFRLHYRPAAGDRPAAGEVDTNGLDLGALTALAAYLPLDESLRRLLAGYAPRGRLKELKLGWSGAADSLKSWHAKGAFANLGLAAVGAVPGFAGLSGSIDGDNKGGSLTLASAQAALELPTVFADPHLALDELAADARWQVDANGIDVQLARAVFRNQDAAGEAAGHYRLAKAGGLGEIDLTAKLTRASGSAVWRYMPLVVNRDVRDWLQGAIAGGSADEATLRLKGDLAKFPFANGKDGIFQVKARFRDAMLRYAPAWPEIRNIDGELLFQGARMLIQGHKGSILGVGIGPVTAEIANLEIPEELITIDGHAAGATADFLKFIEASPVGDRIDHFTEDMKAAGQGELHLRLDMPLRHIVDTRIDGRYRFVNDQLVPDPDMPPLTDVNGSLHFTGERLDAQKIRAAIFGMPLSVDVATAADGSVGIRTAGTLVVRTLAQQFGLPLFDSLSGTAPWSGTIKVKKKDAEVHVESSLQGIASALPEPFNKTTREALPLVMERKPGAAGRSLLNVSLGTVVKATLVRRNDNGKAVVERGAIGVGTPLPRLPERGVLLAVQARRIDLDAWRRLAVGGRGDAASLLGQIDLRADDLIAFGRDVVGLRLVGTQSGGIWKADIKSRDVAGNLEWDGKGAGRIAGRLTQLVIPEAPAGRAAERSDMPEEMPAVDLAIDRCVFHGKDFGAVKIKADNAKDGYWNAKFEVKNDDVTVDGAGRWRPNPAAADTHVDFKLVTKSIEKLLTRLGYPEAVRRGTANVEGALSWKGSPVDVDYPSLNGNIKFEAFGGQFAKLEPGVGRLLGVLSLQSLPRRLTLDFRDVFSQGFAFDGIAADATVTHGVLETQNLKIVGPAAKVLMTGSINLAAETQNLKVRVQPALGESIATGVLLVHPLAGGAAWVFNKIFGNPFDQAFAYEYAVTGSWADPKVEKTAGQPKDAARDGKEGAAK
ncbi:MAG: YhdP family protein [Rhodocyclaceae bacterium]|nr:YhdP family protein [Rhodocyclaceae bacterium]